MTTQVGVEGIVPDFTLGDRLRKARTHAGLTVSELSERAGISEKTVNNYEGERVAPRRPSLIAWALATGVSLAWIETGKVPHDPTPPRSPGLPDDDAPSLDELARKMRSRSRHAAPRHTREYMDVA